YLVIDDFDFLNRTSLKLEKVDRDQNVVILHTLTLYRNIPKLINEFYPGTTFNFTDYSFSKLSSLVSRDWFLNKDFQIHTIGDIVQAFPHYEKFIRPDSGNKAFTGDVYTEEKFLREFKNGINEYSK